MKVTIDLAETLRANGQTTIGFQELGALRKAAFDGALLQALPDQMVVPARPLFRKSRAQLRQDIVALAFCNFKNGGYFVEFGATNGIRFSNTYMLERHFGWTGILAEPSHQWHAELAENRKAAIETDCVWRSTGETLPFCEVTQGELSTLAAFAGKDLHARKRADARTYDVRTISLMDMLAKHDAPQHIDYLSIDTEGSELAILNAFDFDKYRFSVMTCEHNHTDDRDSIHRLLSDAGYVRVMEEISDFDDWYVEKSLV